jgi:hypothetical protein
MEASVAIRATWEGSVPKTAPPAFPSGYGRLPGREPGLPPEPANDLPPSKVEEP